MSVQKYQQARELIESLGSGSFEGSKSESLVAQAEAALGLVFPPSYRRFLLEMGCGDINGVEILGLIDNNFEISSVPNGIWLTLNERRTIGLDPAYVLIREGGDGSYYALDTGRRDDMGESPVVLLSIDGKQSIKIANSFGDHFLDVIRGVV